MLSFHGQQPYTGLKFAFRYRKEYVPGCSCKQAEYDPTVETQEKKKAEVSPPLGPPNGPPGAGVKIGAKK
jgi:hypothetical protein